jgi:hypothetical protein
MIDEYGAVDGMRIGRGNRSTRRKPAPVSTTNPTSPDLGSNTGRRSGEQVPNHLIHGMAPIGAEFLYLPYQLDFQHTLTPLATCLLLAIWLTLPVCSLKTSVIYWITQNYILGNRILEQQI